MQGARATVPLLIGGMPFGIIFGALAISTGLSPLATMGMSVFVFAGAAQFIALGLLAKGVGLAIIILTTFVVNLRHALYSASLATHMQNLSQRWLLPFGFWLTDETYAIVIHRYRRTDAGPNKHWYYLGSALAMYLNWQIFTALGILVGQQLQGIIDWGLEFAMVVSFVGIVVPLLVDMPALICALVAGAAAVIGTLALGTGGAGASIATGVAALLGVASGYLLSRPGSAADTTRQRSPRP